MKKLLLALVVAVLTTASASAAMPNNPPQTDVTGVITKDHVAVNAATVKVVCNGHEIMDTTDAYGSYVASFAGADCPFGSTVKVTAQKGGYSGVASNTVQGITTKLNLAIVNVSIPEFGLIGAVVAGGAGLGLVAFVRRRQPDTFTPNAV